MDEIKNFFEDKIYEAVENENDITVQIESKASYNMVTFKMDAFYIEEEQENNVKKLSLRGVGNNMAAIDLKKSDISVQEDDEGDYLFTISDNCVNITILMAA